MCRIDAPFGDRFLDEKNDPSERFEQVLDEHGADGLFRDLLIKHFSDKWERMFSGQDSFEEALEYTQPYASSSDKCTAFLSAAPVCEHFQSRFFMYVFQLKEGKPGQRDSMVDFTVDVARKFFSKLPHSFYKATIASGPGHLLRIKRYWYLYACYGEDFCFDESFFDDEMLTSMKASEQYEILWGIFEQLIKASEYGADSQIRNLIEAASVQLEVEAEIPSQGARELLRGLKFLKAWVKHEAKSGCSDNSDESMLAKIEAAPWWYGLETWLRSISDAQEFTKDKVKTAETWLCRTKYELRSQYYRYFDLESVSDVEKQRWAEGVNQFFHDYSFYCLDQDMPFDDIANRKNEYLVELCRQLSPLQLETWLQWTISEDFKSSLASDNTAGSASLSQSAKWWGTQFFELCIDKLDRALSRLDFEERLKILSARPDLLLRGGAYQKYNEWCASRQYALIKDDDFPKYLIPRWTVETKNQLKGELRARYIDQSVGILRGELSKEEKSEYYKQLEELLQELDITQSAKALRHRLMLLRSSNVALADESISRIRPLTSYDQPFGRGVPMRELVRQWVAYKFQSMPRVEREAATRVEEECLIAFSHELAEFCLSRLRLRKGEKANEGRYDVNQVIERSSGWRQGYLKALTELGFDLNGKVHKTVYFTKQFDPDEDVRAIASECYRAVRRETKRKCSVEDLKRGIIAAEWWLLLCQRRELGKNIDYEEALKTRRRLLRHP